MTNQSVEMKCACSSGDQAGRTWLQSEEHAYTYGGAQVRRGRAIYPDGKVRAVRAGIPDTFFTVPAHGRIAGRYVSGYLTHNEKGWKFHFASRAAAS